MKRWPGSKIYYLKYCLCFCVWEYSTEVGVSRQILYLALPRAVLASQNIYIFCTNVQCFWFSLRKMSLGWFYTIKVLVACITLMGSLWKEYYCTVHSCMHILYTNTMVKVKLNFQPARGQKIWEACCKINLLWPYCSKYIVYKYTVTVMYQSYFVCIVCLMLLVSAHDYYWATILGLGVSGVIVRGDYSKELVF